MHYWFRHFLEAWWYPVGKKCIQIIEAEKERGYKIATQPIVAQREFDQLSHLNVHKYRSK